MMDSLHKQNNDVTYKLVMSQNSDMTSQTLPTSHGRVALGLSLAQIVFGISLTSLGAALNAYTRLHAEYTSPALWWIGLLPFHLGIFCVWSVFTHKHRRIVYWGVSSLLGAIVTVVLMVICGNYTQGYYHAWPFNGYRDGQPICKTMVDTCYCQDYYHGSLSKTEQPHVQYIYEGAKWKDTGYPTCANVAHVSMLYYVTHVLFGLYVAMTIFISVYTVCFQMIQKKISFQRLRNEEFHIVASFRPDSGEREASPGE